MIGRGSGVGKRPSRLTGSPARGNARDRNETAGSERSYLLVAHPRQRENPVLRMRDRISLSH